MMPLPNRRQRLLAEEDEEESIQYGLRCSRREVSWEYRDSSSLSPLQFMEMEMYYYVAESMLRRAIFLRHVMVLLAVLYQHYNTILNRWEKSRIADRMAQSILRVRPMVNLSKELLDKLSLLMTWIMAYGEVALLCVEDLSIYVRHRHRCQPEKNRTINEISPRNCYTFFGINPDQLRLLYVHRRIPLRFKLGKWSACTEKSSGVRQLDCHNPKLLTILLPDYEQFG